MSPSDTYMSDPNHCPVCGCEDIEGESIEILSGTANQPMTCNGCGSAWTDHYKLTHYALEDVTRAQHDL